MSRQIICHKHPGPCTVRKTTKRIGDIKELAETRTHSDGTKERTIYGRINVRTDEILAFAPMGGLE